MVLRRPTVRFEVLPFFRTIITGSFSWSFVLWLELNISWSVVIYSIVSCLLGDGEAGVWQRGHCRGEIPLPTRHNSITQWKVLRGSEAHGRRARVEERGRGGACVIVHHGRPLSIVNI